MCTFAPVHFEEVCHIKDGLKYSSFFYIKLFIVHVYTIINHSINFISNPFPDFCRSIHTGNEVQYKSLCSVFVVFHGLKQRN